MPEARKNGTATNNRSSRALPARTGDRRRYTDADLRRVAAILVSKQAGFDLADIRALPAARSGPARQEVIAGHRERLLARIARAQAALDMLEGECPHDDIMTCPHFQTVPADRLQRGPEPDPDGRNADRAADRVAVARRTGR